MKRIAFASLLMLLLLPMLLTRPTSALGGGPAANGRFQFLLEDGNTRYLEFDARIQGNDARGTMTFSDPTLIAQVTADFDCMRIEGNRAVMGGVISSSNILDAIGRRVLLVVEDNGEGVNAPAPDRLTWGVYESPATGWIPKDAERDDDNGASLTWIATDSERPDDVGIPSTRQRVVGCQSFPLASYSFVNVGHGNGNIQVKP